MSGDTQQKSSLTRRSFLKATGLLAGVATVAGTASAQLPLCALAADDALGLQDDGVKLCVCAGNCGGRCAMQLHVKDGRAYHITRQPYENPDMEQVCQRGISNLQRMYHPDRLQYPLRRVGERGAGEWERITWDEAIEEITGRWKEYQAEFGERSIMFSGGSGNQRIDMSAGGYMRRLGNFLGSSWLDNCYDNNGLLGLNDTIGSGLCARGNDWRDLMNAKTIFVWGDNVTESSGVRWHWLADAKEAGARLIVIDPCYNITTSKGHEHVPIRPGTDGLLAIGMMQVVLEEGLQDEECLRTKTVAPFLVKDSDGSYLRQSDLGQTDAEPGSKEDQILVMDANGMVVSNKDATSPLIEGAFEVSGMKVTTAYSLLLERLQEWDMATISRHCDIPEDKIRELALVFAEGPTTVMTAFAIDHYTNGFTFYHNMPTLLMLTGNIGKKGAGVSGFVSTGVGAEGSSATMWKPEGVKGYKTYMAPYFPSAIESGKYGKEDICIKAIYFLGHNPLGNQPERNAWLSALSKIDFVVVADLYMSDTAKWADIVLPVPHHYETESHNGLNSYMRITEAAVEPPFECKGDIEIVNMLGEAMGLGEEFPIDRDEFNRMCLDNKSAQKYGITWEKLKEEKIMPAYPDEPFVIGVTGFSTTTGRGQFYFEKAKPNPDLGQEWDSKRESLPYWIPPNEAWYENELMEKYPFVFTSERGKFKVHTQFSNVDMFLEIDPEPRLEINPTDAVELGVETGDTVRVHNERGHLVIKAALNPGIRPGMAVMEHGWWDDQFIDGHYNSVSSLYTHPHYPAGAWFDALVAIEKVAEGGK